MIRLFLADIDGCLAEPYRAFDLEGFEQLRAWGRQAETDERMPRIGLCSGRAYAYVEAVAQTLDLRGPALFESGGGRLDLRAGRIQWNPALTPEVEEHLQTVRVFLLESVVPRSKTVSLDYGKRAQAGIVSSAQGEVAAFLPDVRAFVAELCCELTPYHTPWSIDVVPEALTKREALQWTARDEGLNAEAVAFIGDTDGDAAAIEWAGHGFAPANASEEAKRVASTVTTGTTIDGVLEAYRACLQSNGASGGDCADA